VPLPEILNSMKKENLMYLETINTLSDVARKKATLIKDNPVSFFIGALMAGAYVGMGIILVFTLGGRLDPSVRPLVMGSCFGIALTLVVFAGSELFTGHTMFMTIGCLQGKTGLKDLSKIWTASWLGNLMGAVILAYIYAGGGGALFKESADLLNSVADAKMNKSPSQLFCLGILCNWLVCLALWTSARTKSDATKCVLIFWCLFAFIASGFEHSVANMTVFSIALLGNHPESISLSGAAYNLLWVTLGNIGGGSLFMGMAYWLASPSARACTSEIADKDDRVFQFVSTAVPAPGHGE